MRPCIAMAFHLYRHSELSAHHANPTFVFRVDTLAPVAFVSHRFVNHLKFDTTDEHLAIAVTVPIGVNPK